MPFDGNGTYAPPAPQYPAIPNEVIRAADFNAIIADLAAALSAVLPRDGQAAMTAELSMGLQKVVNVAPGTTPADAVRYDQVFTNPVFTASTVEGVKVQGTALTITVALVDMSSATSLKLPAATQKQVGAAFEDVLTRNGMTGVIDLSNATITLSTPAPGTIGSVGVTADFVYQVAFQTALPLQTGHSGGVVATHAGTAFWEDTVQFVDTADVTVTQGGTYFLRYAGNVNIILPTAGLVDGGRPVTILQKNAQAAPSITNNLLLGTSTLRGPYGTVTGTVALNLPHNMKLRWINSTDKWELL